MDWKIEVIVVPVSDVERSKTYYTEGLGFHLDMDHAISDSFRIVQMTPPGSGCSVTIGVGVADMTPGSLKGVQLVVDDIGRPTRS
jgi:catechol 2,3-dioxygenase-like lactoylglutathione lyase family enzyme